MKYIVFLRGINVGGNKKVPMLFLKRSFEELGFTNVKTLLNSGNAIFETSEKDIKTLTKEIEEKLENVFGFQIPTILRNESEIKKLINADPFKNIQITKNTRLYVSFLSEKSTSTLKLPYLSNDKSFEIRAIINRDIISVLTLSEKMNTTVSMGIIEREYGKNVTTRNWNTVVKIGKLISENL